MEDNSRLVRKQGNSIVMAIPRAILEEHDLIVGDRVKIVKLKKVIRKLVEIENDS